ncbi:VTT domain-containing protein [Devosia sp. XK-2]|uniref:DedA family protein n=1 Tax=Devosia sp. XK-2 TaxID=3126689 RepID=UPI0030D12530
MDILNDLVLPLAASPWVYAIALGLVILDSFFPLFPSEVVIVGLASLAASHAEPDIVLLLLIAALGALVGDTLTYFLGRFIGVRRLQSTRLRPLVRLLRWASRRLGRRAGMVILTARFIPWARLAVNLTAGSTGYAFWRFAPFCLAASTLWAAYNVTMGYLAGHWFSAQPIIGMLAAIILAVALGFLLDAINTRIRRNGPNRPDAQI